MADVSPASTRPVTTQRLRSKTGCVRCRFRRVKCDEIHPSCSGCQRRNLPCIWADEHNGNQHLLLGNKVLTDIALLLRIQAMRGEHHHLHQRFQSPSAVTYLLNNGYASIRSQDEFYLLSTLSQMLRMLTSGTVKDFEHDVHAFSVALESLWVRDAMLAFAAYVCSFARPSVGVQICKYYIRAKQFVQQHLAESSTPQTREQLLVACSFLGVLEANGPSNNKYFQSHFKFVGQLLSSSGYKFIQYHNSSAVEKFHSVVLASYMYNVSRLSFFCSQMDTFSVVQTNAMSQSLLSQFELDNLVLLRFDPLLYTTFIQLNRFARLSAVEILEPAEAASLSAIGRSLEERSIQAKSTLSSFHLEFISNNVLEYWRESALVAGCLRIFWSKINNRDLLAKDYSLRPLLKDCISHLDQYTIHGWNGELCWILAILVCAAHTVKETRAIFAIINKLKDGIQGPDLVIMQKVIASVRHVRQRQSSPRNTDSMRIDGPIFSNDPQPYIAKDTLDLLLEIEAVVDRDI